MSLFVDRFLNTNPCYNSVVMVAQVPGNSVRLSVHWQSGIL